MQNFTRAERAHTHANTHAHTLARARTPFLLFRARPRDTQKRFLSKHLRGGDCKKFARRGCAARASKRPTKQAEAHTKNTHTHAPRVICFAVTARGVTATFLFAQNKRTRTQTHTRTSTAGKLFAATARGVTAKCFLVCAPARAREFFGARADPPTSAPARVCSRCQNLWRLSTSAGMTAKHLAILSAIVVCLVACVSVRLLRECLFAVFSGMC